MKETFQHFVMLAALAGLAVSLGAMALRSDAVCRALANLLSMWRGLTAPGRFVAVTFLLVGILVGGDKTNNVPPNMNSPLPQMMQGGGLFPAGFSWLTGMTGLLGSGSPAPQTFAAKRAANWNVRGAWKDSFWLDFEDGWVFPHGLNHLSGVEVVSFGQVWPTPFDTNAVASTGEPFEIVPGLTTFAYEFTPSNSYRFVWTDAAVGRDTNSLVSAALELFRNGDMSVETNGVAAFLPRELPFAHDGFGQDDEWVAANFTNATEILSVGYADWVDAQVGEGLTNGLYRLTVSVDSVPPETTCITVGDLSVAVTNAGDYVFLLEKGPSYDLTIFPPSDGVEISATDDVPALRSPPVLRVIVNGDDNDGIGEWTPDGGEFWTDYAAGMGHARFWWLPMLTGSPDVAHIGPSESQMTFSAILTDCRRTNDVAYSWSASEGLTVASPNSRTTGISIDDMPSWAQADISVTATVCGNPLTSQLAGLTYGTNDTPQVHLSLILPTAILLNSNEVNMAKIAAAGWTFSSDAPTSGVVRVTCLFGGERVHATGLVGEWSVDEGFAVAATVEGIAASSAVGDVVFRMEFDGGDCTNALEKSLTVVRTGDVVLPNAPPDGLVVLTNTPIAIALDCEPSGAGALLTTTWHTRRLKSDGSHDEWQLAEYNHAGSAIVFTPTLGGIYQVRALASVAAGGTDERFYVWEEDEDSMIGQCRKGEPKSIGVVSHVWQQTLLNCARGFLGSTAYLSTEALPAQYGFPAYPAGDITFKCNIFVAHRIVQAGLQCPKTRGWLNSYPPLANDWANSSYEIGDWVALPQEGYPEPGYVAADPDPDTSGHMGILDFDGFGISAGMSNVNRHFDTGSSNIVRRKLEE